MRAEQRQILGNVSDGGIPRRVSKSVISSRNTVQICRCCTLGACGSGQEAADFVGEWGSTMQSVAEAIASAGLILVLFNASDSAVEPT